MPYGKRYRKKSSYSNKKIARIARKVAQKAQPLKMFQRIITTEFGSVGTAGSQLDITTLLTQGNDYDDREGRQVYITGVLIDGVLETGDTLNVLRVVSTLDSAGTTLGYTLNTQVNKLIGNCQRRLLDKTYVMNRNDSTVNVYKRIKHWIPVNKKFTFPGTSGSANQELYVYMVSDSSAVPNPGFSYGTISIYFRDA